MENLAVKDMILLDRLNWWEVLQKVIRMQKIWKQRSPLWLDCGDQSDEIIEICRQGKCRILKKVSDRIWKKQI